jgi:hypothetical protein
MPPRPTSAAQNRAIAIPQRVQQEMAQHMQKTLPANLQYYQKSGGYVPPAIQKQMAQHMEKTMPNHLKQYINPYMQQQVVPQHLGPTPVSPTGLAKPTPFNVRHTPLSPLPNQQPSQVIEPQLAPQSPPLPPEQVPQSAQPQTPPTAAEPYAFITDSQNTPKPPTLLSIFSGKSLAIRIGVGAGGLVVLLILFNVLKGLFVQGFDLPPFVSVLQDQQELIHITTNVIASPGAASLPGPYQNFVTTTQVAVTSSQAQLLTYLSGQKQKIKPGVTSLKIKPTLDTQLTNAIASNTYMSTVQQVMSSQLTTYMSDLHAAYAKIPGKHGRAQLSDEYNQAALLVKQLDEADGTATT